MNEIDHLTLGVEEEYQIIDTESRELTSFISDFLKHDAKIFRDQIKPELLQSQVEVESNVCQNIQEMREDISKLRCVLSDFYEKNNRVSLRIFSSRSIRWFKLGYAVSLNTF